MNRLPLFSVASTPFVIAIFSWALYAPGMALHAQEMAATPTPSATMTAPSALTATDTPTASLPTTDDQLAQGIHAYQAGDLAVALSYLQAAKANFVDDADQPNEGLAWLYLGRVYAAQAEVEAAKQALETSARIWEATADEERLLETLQAIGDLHLANHNDEQAMTTYTTALALAQTLANPEVESTVRAQLAQAAFNRYQAEYQHDLTVAQQAGDLTKAASLFNKLGDLYRGVQQVDEAIAAYEGELAIRRELQESANIADALRAIGDLYAEQNNFTDAAPAYQEAATLWEALNEQSKAAAIYNDLGMLQLTAADYPAAVTAFTAELTLRVPLAADAKTATAYENLSTAYLALEDYAAAEQALTEAASLWYADGNLAKTRDAHQAVAELLHQQQAYPAAIDHYTTAISLTRTLAEEKPLADLLTDAAAAYVAAAESSLAVPYYEEALTLWQELEQGEDELSVLRKLADLHQELGAPTQSINYLLQAIPLAQVEKPTTVAKLYEELGAAYRANQAIARSLDAYRQALTHWQQGDEPIASLDTLNALGDIYYREQRDYPTALEYFMQALKLARAANARDKEAYFLRRLGDSQEKQQAYPEALTFYQQSLAIWRALKNNSEQQKLAADIAKTEELLAEQQLALRTENGIVAPADQETVSGVIDVRGLATDPNFQKWQLDLLLNGAAAGATFLEVSRSAAPAVKRLTELDTTQYPNGTHILRLRVVRTDFNYDEYSVTITIAN